MVFISTFSDPVTNGPIRLTIGAGRWAINVAKFITVWSIDRQYRPEYILRRVCLLRNLELVCLKKTF